MVGIRCPYCGKEYQKAKHLQNHIEKKHRELIDLMSLPASEKEESEGRAAEPRLPKNPMDMTPDVFLNLTHEQSLNWLFEVARYRQAQIMIDAALGKVDPQSSTAYQALPFEIDEKLRDLERLRNEKMYRDVTEPMFAEMKELIIKVAQRCINLENELKQVKSSVDWCMLSSLRQIDMLWYMRVG